MTRNVDTKIQFSGLKSGVYTYDFTLDDGFFSEWKNEKILAGDVFFDVKMEKSERMLMFFFSFRGTVSTVCDRCLAPLQWPIEGEEKLCVKFSDTENSDDEDVVFLPEKESSIDLAQWMYEFVAVRMPIQCFHPDNADGTPTCDPDMMQFLMPDADTSDHSASDPRWDALRALRD